MSRAAHARHAAWLGILLLSACTTIEPVQRPNRLTVTPAGFSHDRFDRVLNRFVDEDGLVDYAGLASAPSDLDAYLGQVAAYSPDSHPALFRGEAERLAYWINAYNAITMRFVLEHHPVASVMDVVSPWATPLLPRGAGFFFGHRFPIGGDHTSLLALEHRVVRKRFVDARYHFALNCASLGCPELPAEAFDPARLDAQLARETGRFLSESRNLRWDASTRTVFVSQILDAFEGDFVAWQRQRGGAASLLDFVADHVGDPERAAVARRAVQEDWSVERIPYDWRLNDQGLGPRPEAPAPGS